MHQVFHTAAARNLRPYAYKSAHGLLRRFLKHPDNVIGNLHHMAGTTIMAIAYGLEIQEEGDPYLKLAEVGNHTLSSAVVPGKYMVEYFPFLRYLPEWMPGGRFKKEAREVRKVADNMLEMPFKAARDRIESGTYLPSFTSYSYSRIDEKDDLAWQEYLVKATAATIYSDGTDTTVSAMAYGLIGLLNRPDVLRRAQEEIDAAIAFGDLPTFDDEDKLPMLKAICLEALRWENVIPMPIPRMLTEDDVYKGYRLPKGSMVISNLWAMLHNKQVYPDPFSFKPERFLKDGKVDPSVPNPIDIVFGYGRRLCPGRQMAFDALWITLASLIAAFDITKAVDENGNVIEVRAENDGSSLLCVPDPFKCSMKPRSQKHLDTIDATLSQQYDYAQW